MLHGQPGHPSLFFTFNPGGYNSAVLSPSVCQRECGDLQSFRLTTVRYGQQFLCTASTNTAKRVWTGWSIVLRAVHRRGRQMRRRGSVRRLQSTSSKRVKPPHNCPFPSRNLQVVQGDFRRHRSRDLLCWLVVAQITMAASVSANCRPWSSRTSFEMGPGDVFRVGRLDLKFRENGEKSNQHGCVPKRADRHARISDASLDCPESTAFPAVFAPGNSVPSSPPAIRWVGSRAMIMDGHREPGSVVPYIGPYPK